MKEEAITIKQQVEEIIASGICEPSRLHHILSMIEKEKSLYKSDLAYMEKMKDKLVEKMNHLQEENKEINYTLQKPKLELNTGRIIYNEKLFEDEELDDLLHQQTKQEELKRNEIKSDILTN